ncbi:hypothetical protein [Streptomyces mirabilis]|uniref:hypothetical protein n=1 Tax=Streptomyces mirabilis TaxID=68239 RepID=UPI003417E426
MGRIENVEPAGGHSMTENSVTVDAELVDGSLPAVATAAAVSLRTARDHEVSDVTRQALEDSITDNTRRAYDRQWNTFTTWCATEQRVALPATPKTLGSGSPHPSTWPSSDFWLPTVTRRRSPACATVSSSSWASP